MTLKDKLPFPIVILFERFIGPFNFDYFLKFVCLTTDEANSCGFLCITVIYFF